jgi:hypothetical protein
MKDEVKDELFKIFESKSEAITFARRWKASYKLTPQLIESLSFYGRPVTYYVYYPAMNRLQAYEREVNY